MRNLFILFALILAYGTAAIDAEAATVSLNRDGVALNPGDIFTIDVLVDSEGRLLNAVDVEVMFPSDLMEYQSSDDSNSIINLWVTKPTFRDNEIISFAGITPGGFAGHATNILTLNFKALTPGYGSIEISKAQLLKHDGLGTEEFADKQNIFITVAEGESSVDEVSLDAEKPESFTPAIVKDIDLYGGVNTLIFATQDKGVGMDRFEVKEGVFGSYQIAESPYRLRHQSLDKKIFVKAVDRSGNERVEIVYPQNWRPWYKQRLVIVCILILCILAIYMGRKSFWVESQK